MTSIRKLSIHFAILSTLTILPLKAFAGGPNMVIDITAAPTAVPTLSGVMLVVLSLLLFAVAVRVTKQKKSGINKLFVTLLGVGSLSLITGGMQIVSKADAALHGPLIDAQTLLDSTLGERRFSLLVGSTGYNLFTNENSGVIATIKEINQDSFQCGDTPPNTIFTDEPGSPSTIRTEVPDVQTCTEGLSLGTGASCDLFCRSPRI